MAATKLYTFCSLSMALFFAYSASVQLNDPDWYFWFPLYSHACVVNLLGWTMMCKKVIRHIAHVVLWLGIFLFVKVVVEDMLYGIAGFWSLDLSERVVREKIGSGLVAVSMFLQLEAFFALRASSGRKKKEFPRYVVYGMAILVSISYGLPFRFFVIQQGGMKF